MKKVFFFLAQLFFLLNFSSAQQWVTSGNNIYNTNTGSVGIGVTNPVWALEVNGGAHFYDGIIADSRYVGFSGWFRGVSNNNANVIVQGDGGQAYWLTGTNGTFKIGGSGSTEPSQGAINIDYLGNVSIGTTNNYGYKLAVNGTAIFTEARVKLYANWPDYVFHKNYKLIPINELDRFIRTNNHLPGMPSAEELKEKEGFDLGDMSTKLLQKIEELTLYIIELKKENDKMKTDLTRFCKKLAVK